MVMRNGYLVEVNLKLGQIETDWGSNYCFEFDGFKDPPLIDVVAMLDEITESQGKVSITTREALFRKMIQGKLVKVLYKDKELGSFTLNDERTPLGDFPVLRNNPSALKIFMSLAVATLMEKCLPPQIATPPAAAQLPTLRSRKSSEGQG